MFDQAPATEPVKPVAVPACSDPLATAGSGSTPNSRFAYSMTAAVRWGSEEGLFVAGVDTHSAHIGDW